MDAIASMYELARTAMSDMPPQRRFTDDDAAVVRDAKELLLAHEADFVQGFYDVVYRHPATAALLHEGERPEREEALVEWWRRTVNGPLNDQYFAWMAMVGLSHVTRNVSIPMMLGMTDWAAHFVAEKVAATEMDVREAENLVEAFRRLTATVGAVITYAYDQAIVSALSTVAGMPEALLRRLRDQEVNEALILARAELGRR